MNPTDEFDESDLVDIVFEKSHTLYTVCEELGITIDGDSRYYHLYIFQNTIGLCRDTSPISFEILIPNEVVKDFLQLVVIAPNNWDYIKQLLVQFNIHLWGNSNAM